MVYVSLRECIRIHKQSKTSRNTVRWWCFGAHQVACPSLGPNASNASPSPLLPLSTCTILTNFSRAATPTPFFADPEVVFVFFKLLNLHKFRFASSYARFPSSPPTARFIVRSSAAEHRRTAQRLPSTFIHAPLVCKFLIAATRPLPSHFLFTASLVHSSKRCVRPSHGSGLRPAPTHIEQDSRCQRRVQCNVLWSILITDPEYTNFV